MILTDWKVAFANKKFRFHFFLALMGLAAFAAVLPFFFNAILLPKPGVQLNDPILSWFQPRDWSNEIFLLLYGCTLVFIATNIMRPGVVLISLQTYVVVNFLRLTTLYFFTLEPPQGIIPLTDHFLASLAYGQPVYNKDLFFSGHVSTLFVLVFAELRPVVKWIYLTVTVIVATLLAWQRVHYALDMAGALVFTTLIFWFFRRFNQRMVAAN